ncbi:MAG TPA: hypothetical protein VIF57_20705 [Polyangia bacterium]
MSGLIISCLLALQIEGAGGCPAAAEVEGKLVPLLAPGSASVSTDRAIITEDGDGLSISLARPDGMTVARRRLPRARTCAEQAETVAVTLAVWEAQIHPEISLRLDRLADQQPAPAPNPAAAAAPPPVDREKIVARSSERPPAREILAAVGVAAAGGWQPDSVAPGGRIDATLGAAGRGWRARLSLAALGRHTVRLPPGEATWWRGYVAPGADYQLPIGRRWQLSLGAGAVLGVMTAQGSGFSVDRSSRSIDLGVETMLQIALRPGTVRPWLGVGLLTWLRRQTLDVGGQAASTVLSRVEPMLALGADFCWRP